MVPFDTSPLPPLIFSQFFVNLYIEVVENIKYLKIRRLQSGRKYKNKFFGFVTVL